MLIRLLTILAFTVLVGTDPRSPRIYNVLITSKKNLSPSHAQPVYEPVLRATPIGYFPPWIYNPYIQNIPYLSQDYASYGPIINQQHSAAPKTEDDSRGQTNQFVGPLNPYALNFSQYLPKDEESTNGVNTFPLPVDANEQDPKKVIANLKKNPAIPDVPPPPLPVRFIDKD